MARITLVFLPGMDGTGQLFEPLIGALRGEFDVKVITYPTGEALGYAELETIVRSALPRDIPYIIVGESFSGPIAVSIAASVPLHLLGVVLCCTFVRNPRPALSGLRALIGLLPIGPMPISILSRWLLGRFSTAALRATLARSLAEVSPTVLRRRLAAVLSVDVSDKLAAVRVPLLYLRASSDRLVPPTACAAIVRLNRGTEIVEIDAPHFLLQVAPIEAARALAAFSRGVQNSD